MTGELPEVRSVFSVEEGRLVERRAPLARPGRGEVVVRVAGAALGRAPGAEVAGEVIAAGEAADEWCGRRVVAPRLLPCGDCEPCRRGRAASCPRLAARSGLASHEVVPARYLVHLDERLWPAGLPPDELWRLAALPDGAGGPHGALVRAGCEPNQLVVVVGEGAAADLAADVARALGAHGVVVPPTDAADPAALAEEARRRGASDEPWRILVTDGRPASLARAAALCPDGGVLLWLRDEARAAPPALEALRAREPSLLVSDGAHPDLLPELCALAARGELPLSARTAPLAPGDAVAAGPHLPILRLP